MQPTDRREVAVTAAPRQKVKRHNSKGGQGLHSLDAVTAVALKVTRVTARILTNRRDYKPQRPPAATLRTPH
ncbi:MAG TPA: hypothetical protein PLP66_05970 [Phycisphaerae bacterium]|nr:hypothetical protein [Phycisphaerae bacterium]HQL55818.1 hypothetical protein [Phycisphaerae bacterium]